MDKANALATLPVSDQQHRIFWLVDTAPELGARSKAQYRRAVRLALEAGVDFTDQDAVRAHMASVSKSERAFLSAALRRWYKDGLSSTRVASSTDMARQAAAAEGREASPGDVLLARVAKDDQLNRLEALLDATATKQRDEGQATHTWLTPGEVRTLLASVHGRTARRDRVLLALLVGAGLRRDEAVRLTWQDVKRQGERTVLAVEGKGAKQRTVPISKALEAMLDDWRDYCEAQKSERVLRGIVKRRLTDSLTGTQVYNVVQKYGRLIGKDDLAPHDLRRTYAQLAYAAGVPLTQLQRELGHAKLATTQRYLNTELRLDVVSSDFVPL